MAKCPYCNESIDTLDVVIAERNLYLFMDGEYYSRDSIQFDIQHCQCPLCHLKLEDIAPDEDAMKEFLKGGDNGEGCTETLDEGPGGQKSPVSE